MTATEHENKGFHPFIDTDHPYNFIELKREIAALPQGPG